MGEWTVPPQRTIPDLYDVMTPSSHRRCTIGNAVGNIPDPVMAGSFGTGLSEYHNPTYTSVGNPNWYFSNPGTPYYHRADSLIFNFISWDSPSAVDFIPELGPGETVQYRGVSEVVSVGVILWASGHAVTDVVFRVPVVRPSNTSPWVTGEVTGNHGEASPGGRLLGVVTPGYPYASELWSPERLTVSDGSLVRSEYEWGPSWEVAVYMHRTGLGDPLLAVNVGSTADAGYYFSDIVVQPREYRVIGDPPNLGGVAGPNSRFFK